VFDVGNNNNNLVVHLEGSNSFVDVAFSGTSQTTVTVKFSPGTYSLTAGGEYRVVLF
jgi:hypothetical protein